MVEKDVEGVLTTGNSPMPAQGLLLPRCWGHARGDLKFSWKSNTNLGKELPHSWASECLLSFLLSSPQQKPVPRCS